MPSLTLSFDESVAVLTLSAPSGNRFGVDMVNEMDKAIDHLLAKGARAVLLQADGPDFCHGGDIIPWMDSTSREIQSVFERYMNVFNRLERLPIPVIAAVQGLCNGGGWELVLRADILFAGANTRFSHSEQSVAFVTVIGGTYRVAERAGRLLAYQWALTSEEVPAEVAAKHGLVNYIVADDAVQGEALAFAKRVAKGATKAHAGHKALLRAWSVGGIAAADDVMFDLTSHILDSEDTKRGIANAVTALKAGTPRPVLEFNNR